jgi:hypothetical protein
MKHATMDAAARRRVRLVGGLIRPSVDIEGLEKLRGDLRPALEPVSLVCEGTVPLWREASC